MEENGQRRGIGSEDDELGGTSVQGLGSFVTIWEVSMLRETKCKWMVTGEYSRSLLDLTVLVSLLDEIHYRRGNG